jgi:hypothetical protein
MIPAIFTFINVYKENKVSTEISAFIKNEIKSNRLYQLMDDSFDEEKKILSLNFFNEVSEAEKNSLQNRLLTDPRYANCKDIVIDIKGSDTKTFELITTAYKDKKQELEDSKRINDALRTEIEDLKTTITSLNQSIEQKYALNNQKAVAFSRISKDAKIRYNEILQIGFANVLSSKDFIKIDTIPTVTIQWSATLNDSLISIKERELRSWLQNEMQLDTLFIKREK